MRDNLVHINNYEKIIDSDKKTITLQIDKILLRKLHMVCKETNRNKSQLVNDILNNALEHIPIK
ncbi:hypothetical protein [Anaeromicrobium sediminis]|uniref:CopG family transcriptional regulator n=1 Tax=Anaeromicrobium sediminis TaxID=1478221 RepID=A0A267MBL4_9FIRM|nr:hypothetical protein [Anaeromicrobium sediminis]PAB56926.1 hypothetical protein CCE28_20140 [Anaeromicrobium sediminis]